MAEHPPMGRGAAVSDFDLDETGRSVEEAQRALMERPQLSIRTRIIIGLIVLAVLSAGVTFTAVRFLSSFEARIVFLENAGSYAFEIDEARRNEKNYFLYGTNLAEALSSAGLAERHLRENAEAMRTVVGEARFREMEARLHRYQGLLEELLRIGRSEAPEDMARRQEIEVLLRAEGAQLLEDAQEMISRERLAVSSMLRTSSVAAWAFLAVFLLMMVLFGGFVVRAVLGPLNRFLEYVGRIGAGNYEPIRPARRYRDEFSQLAMAFNRMLSEIGARQEQLVRSGKMASVGTLTSGIAHELNNPLNNIGLTVEALIDDFDSYSPEQKRRMLEQVYTQVERASATVRNLLDFTRKGPSAFTEVAVADAINSAVRLVANEARISGVRWNLRLERDLPPVRGNPNDLQQVFLNLFLNAIQAMPDGGEISIEAHTGPAGEVCIEVSDTGAGIAPEHIDQVFDPFFTTKDPGQGTGLGLAVSHSIVEKHGGTIGIRSVVGEGTTFILTLPRSEAAEERRP